MTSEMYSGKVQPWLQRVVPVTLQHRHVHQLDFIASNGAGNPEHNKQKHGWQDTADVSHLSIALRLSACQCCSLRLLKWPASMQLQIWEQGTFRDTLLCQFYLVVPGLAGTPHVDPQAKPYSWTSTEPVPHQKLLQAATALQPLGVVPAVNVEILQQQQKQLVKAAAGHSSSQAGGAEGASSQTGAADAADAAGSSSSAGADPRGKSVAAVYPSGRLFVRCGWVADHGVESHVTPFEGSSGAFAARLARQVLHGAPGIAENDGMVQVSVAGVVDATAAAAGAGPGSPLKGRSTTLSAAGFAGSPHASPDRSRGKSAAAAAAGVTAEGPDKVFGNPLAHIGEDVEVGQRLAPPLPHMKADKALQRAAIGGNKVSELPAGLSEHASLMSCTTITDCVQVALPAHRTGWQILGTTQKCNQTHFLCCAEFGAALVAVQKCLSAACIHKCLVAPCCVVHACRATAALPPSGWRSSCSTPTTRAMQHCWSCCARAAQQQAAALGLAVCQTCSGTTTCLLAEQAACQIVYAE